jgi:hypothetical protein
VNRAARVQRWLRRLFIVHGYPPDEMTLVSENRPQLSRLDEGSRGEHQEQLFCPIYAWLTARLAFVASRVWLYTLRLGAAVETEPKVVISGQGLKNLIDCYVCWHVGLLWN